MLNCTDLVKVPLTQTDVDPNPDIIGDTINSEPFFQVIRELIAGIPNNAHGIFVVFYTDVNYAEEAYITVDGMYLEIQFRSTLGGKFPEETIRVCYGLGCFE